MAFVDCTGPCGLMDSRQSNPPLHLDLLSDVGSLGFFEYDDRGTGQHCTHGSYQSLANTCSSSPSTDMDVSSADDAEDLQASFDAFPSADVFFRPGAYSRSSGWGSSSPTTMSECADAFLSCVHTQGRPSTEAHSFSTELPRLPGTSVLPQSTQKRKHASFEPARRADADLSKQVKRHKSAAVASSTTAPAVSCARARKLLTAGTRVVVKVMAAKPAVDLSRLGQHMGRTGVIISAPPLKQGLCYWHVMLDAVHGSAEFAAPAEQIK